MSNFIDHTLDKVTDTIDSTRDHITGGIAGIAGSVAKAASASLAERTNLPERISIVDIFHRRLYNKVDFTYIISYMRQNQLACCEGLYTIDTLVSEVIAPQTKQSLQDRSPKELLELYGTVIKLCIRMRRNLVVYLDPLNGKATIVRKLNTFLDLAELNPSVKLKDIWFDTHKAIPSLKYKKIKFTTEQSLEETDTSSLVQTPTSKDRRNEAKNLAKAQFAQQMSDELPVLESVTATEQSSIFSGNEIDYRQTFLIKWNTDADIDIPSLLNDELASFELIKYLFKKEVTDPNTDLNTCITDIISHLGITSKDFYRLLKDSSGNYLPEFRSLYNLAEGDGSSNDKIMLLLGRVWVRHTGIYLNTQQSFKELWIRGIEHDKEIKRREEETMARLNNASSALKTSTIDSEDILI